MKKLKDDSMIDDDDDHDNNDGLHDVRSNDNDIIMTKMICRL